MGPRSVPVGGPRKAAVEKRERGYGAELGERGGGQECQPEAGGQGGGGCRAGFAGHPAGAHVGSSHRQPGWLAAPSDRVLG